MYVVNHVTSIILLLYSIVITLYHCHHTEQVTILCPPHAGASKMYALVGHRNYRLPVQVTVGPAQHQHHSDHHMCQRVNALKG